MMVVHRRVEADIVFKIDQSISHKAEIFIIKLNQDNQLEILAVDVLAFMYAESFILYAFFLFFFVTIIAWVVASSKKL